MGSKGYDYCTIGTVVASFNTLVSIRVHEYDLIIYFTATDHGHYMIYTVDNRLSKFAYFIPCKHVVSAAELA